MGAARHVTQSEAAAGGQAGDGRKGMSDQDPHICPTARMSSTSLPSRLPS